MRPKFDLVKVNLQTRLPGPEAASELNNKKGDHLVAESRRRRAGMPAGTKRKIAPCFQVICLLSKRPVDWARDRYGVILVPIVEARRVEVEGVSAPNFIILVARLHVSGNNNFRCSIDALRWRIEP